MYKNNTIDTEECEVLKDSIGDKERPWKDKKISSIELAKSYKRLGSNKAYRVWECGSFLEFKRYKEDNSLKLHNANFCKVRLCPMCAWRRSLKIFGQVSKVMDQATKVGNYRFIFLTLTCKNVYGEELSEMLDILFYAFNKLTKRKAFKKSVKGWFRGLEVTHNTNKISKSYNTYHPHFHMVLAVTKSYFNDKDYYISQEKWTSLWKACLKVDYIPIVDVRAFKTGSSKTISKSVAEAAKYAVKDGDYMIKGFDGEIDKEATDNAVWILDSALARRRLSAFGGVLKDIHKALNLDDAEEGDLVNTDNDDEIRDDLNYVIERYNWSIGLSNYIRVKERNE